MVALRRIVHFSHTQSQDIELVSITLRVRPYLIMKLRGAIIVKFWKSSAAVFGINGGLLVQKHMPIKNI
jgi:hypothetical protein